MLLKGLEHVLQSVEHILSDHVVFRNTRNRLFLAGTFGIPGSPCLFRGVQGLVVAEGDFREVFRCRGCFILCII